MAYLASRDDHAAESLRRAMVYGAAMGSFAVEKFGVDGFDHVTAADVHTRCAPSRTWCISAWRTEVTESDRYAAAGVSLSTAEEAKRRIGEVVQGTRTPLALGRLGAFAGMVRVPPGMRRPVLVMSTDGVGTKVLVALRAGVHDTVGEDLVNHCVNDILVHGAAPLAFLDYIATGTLVPEVATAVVAGIARAAAHMR